MSDEIDKEVTSRKVTSNSNIPVDGYRTTEQTTKSSSVDNGSTGLVVGILALLVLGAGATAYYLNNNRPNSTIVVPGATNTIKENKSTIIERNNTTNPSPAPAPDININVPPQPTPNVDVNVAPVETPPSTPTTPPNN